MCIRVAAVCSERQPRRVRACWAAPPCAVAPLRGGFRKSSEAVRPWLCQMRRRVHRRARDVMASWCMVHGGSPGGAFGRSCLHLHLRLHLLLHCGPGTEAAAAWGAASHSRDFPLEGHCVHTSIHACKRPVSALCATRQHDRVAAVCCFMRCDTRPRSSALRRLGAALARCIALE